METIGTEQQILTRMTKFKELLGHSDDIKFRLFETSPAKLRGFILFIDGIVDVRTIQMHVVDPLINHEVLFEHEEQFIRTLMDSVLQASEMKTIPTIDEAIKCILDGYTIITFASFATMIAVNTTAWKERSFTEPEGQRTVKGPNIGFTESRSGNIALLRKVIKHPGLHVETKECGEYTNTSVSLIYVEPLVDKLVLRRIRDRLDELSMQSILESNYIQEYFTKDVKTIFPLLLNTDRPDVVAGEILEGRVCIMTDGTPYALIAPAVLIQFFQAADDYYLPYHTVSVLRPFRLLLYILSLLIPSIYVALTTLHPSLIPIEFMISMVAQRELVPFPTVVEVLIVLILIETIIEGSNRLPKNMTFAISVFGAIVFGQAAVEAQLVQPITLVVLSLSFIFTSLVPIVSFSYATRIMKLLFIAAGTFLGLYGIVLICLLLLVHMCYLRSFGVPYLSPIAPFHFREQRDTLIRASIPKMNRAKTSFQHEEFMEEKAASEPIMEKKS